MSPSKSKKVLGIEDAAAYTGLSVEDLLRSRGRGLAPGSLGYKKDGALVWNQSDLTKGEVTEPAKKAAEGPQEASEDNADENGDE